MMTPFHGLRSGADPRDPRPVHASRRTPLTLLLLAAACGGDNNGSGQATGEASGSPTSATGSTGSTDTTDTTTPSPTTSAASSDASSSTTSTTTGDPDSSTGDPPPHVEIAGDALRIDGVPTFLYGGDLHYFRVRDPDFDAPKTHAMWAATLDAMQAAGMNMVSTYVPWDYHSPAPDTYDFTGARDLGVFLDMACGRGMHVVFKPGPLITGEWPRGFGTFGAVPPWFKDKHPEALVRDAKGALWTYSPTNDPTQRQPTYLHETYLAAVKAWYAAAFAVARPHLGGCIVAVQVDNETNLYWGDRFGGVDYSDTALAFYRDFLQQKYGDIAALNARYKTAHKSFAAVAPPTSKPGAGAGEWPKNPWYADWYWAGQAYAGAYLAQLQAMIVAEGFAPPAALHFTNDSPFTLLFDDLPLRNVLVHDGPTKNAIGVAGLDLYPKQFTTNNNLQDQPFQADYFTRLYDHHGDLATGPQDFAYAAELQGGFYAYPVLGHPKVAPAATDQLLARSIGRGLKGGSFYVIRDGLNLDNSDYDYQAALTADGDKTGRYEVMARWGALLQTHGQDLLAAREVTERVLVLANGNYAAPQGGLLDDLQRFYTMEMPALFGWLAHAGINPVIRDARTLTADELANFDLVFYPNPDFIDDPTATLLADYVAAGGTLVQLLWPGQRGADFVPTPASSHLSQTLFPGVPAGQWVWLGPSRSGPVNADFSGYQGKLTSYWYASFWEAPDGPAFAPFLWERTEPFGDNGDVVAYIADDAAGRRIFVGANLWARYNQDDYYSLPASELEQSRTLARFITDQAGITPAVRATGIRHLAWARRSPTALYLFVINDNAAAGPVHVDLHDAAALQLDPAANYSVTEALHATQLPAATGQALLDDGVTVQVDGLSTAVLVLTAM